MGKQVYMNALGIAFLSTSLIWEAAFALDVTRYLKGENKTRIIISGDTSTLTVGTILETWRNSTPDNSLENSALTGEVKITELSNDGAVAEVLSESSTESKIYYPEYPGIMEKDFIKIQARKFSKVSAIFPITEVSFYHIFEDPKQWPNNFEISDSGIEKLDEIAKKLRSATAPALIIEAYTDPNGPSDANQIESQQRALSIQQYLVDQHGFDPKRVIPIGYGENEQIGHPGVAGYRQKNRRVVFRLSWNDDQTEN